MVMQYDLIQALNLRIIKTARISSPNIGMGGSNDTTGIFPMLTAWQLLNIFKGTLGFKYRCLYLICMSIFDLML